MDSALVLFKQLVHLNLNLAVLVLVAWVLLGKGRGNWTSLVVWCALGLRVLVEPFLCAESVDTPVVDHSQQGMLAVGLGLGWLQETLQVIFGVGEQHLSVGDLAVMAVGESNGMVLGTVAFLIVASAFFHRLLQLARCPGEGKGLVVFPGVRSPHISGWLRPTIVVPLELDSCLEKDEMEAVMAHERAHVQAGDHRLFALLYLTGALCWVVWPLRIVLDGIEQSIERLRDRQAAEQVGPRAVARALVKLAQCPGAPQPAFCGGSVQARLRALRPGCLKESRLVALLAMVLLEAVIL